MEVILKEEIKGLGAPLAVVKVKTGYAHNFLFPRKLAVLATKATRRELETLRVKAEEKLLKEKGLLQTLADKLKDKSFTIAAKVHEGEKLYGSIQGAEIANKIREGGFDVDKKFVVLAEPIKQLGMYTIKLQLHKEVETKVKLWVISDESK